MATKLTMTTAILLLIGAGVLGFMLGAGSGITQETAPFIEYGSAEGACSALGAVAWLYTENDVESCEWTNNPANEFGRCRCILTTDF